MSRKIPQNDLWAIEPAYLESLLYHEDNRAEVFSAQNALVFEKSAPIFSGQKNGSMAIINLHGAMYRSTQARVKREIEEALSDSSISSIMFNINSPGGLVSGTKELADFIYSIRKTKPMGAYVDGLCASAAMWVASAIGNIYAPVTANLGSIGVISVLPNYSGLNKSWGIDYTYIKAGKWKAVGNSDFAPTADERDYLQARIDTLHEIFKADIEKNLNLKCDASLWNEAQIFLAREAKDMGFVKAIVQDFSEACTIACSQFTKKENRKMDRETLLKEHPELAQSLIAEGKAEGKSEGEKMALVGQKAEINAQTPLKAPIVQTPHAEIGVNPLMALFAVLLPKEQFASVQNIVSACDTAGISYDKASALAPLLLAANSQTQIVQTPDQDAQGKILAQLQEITSSPLGMANASLVPEPKSALVADAEKRK